MMIDDEHHEHHEHHDHHEHHEHDELDEHYNRDEHDDKDEDEDEAWYHGPGDDLKANRIKSCQCPKHELVFLQQIPNYPKICLKSIDGHEAQQNMIYRGDIRHDTPVCCASQMVAQMCDNLGDSEVTACRYC